MGKKKNLGGFSKSKKTIDPLNLDVAFQYLVFLKSLKQAGFEVHLYDTWSERYSTTRFLCILFGTTPNATNQNNIKKLIEHWRKQSAVWSKALNEIVKPSQLSLRRRNKADAKRRAEEEAEEAAATEMAAKIAAETAQQLETQRQHELMDLGTDWIIDNQGPSVEEAPAAATAPPAEEMEKRKSVDDEINKMPAKLLWPQFRSTLKLLQNQGSKLGDKGLNLKVRLDSIFGRISNITRDSVSVERHSLYVQKVYDDNRFGKPDPKSKPQPELAPLTEEEMDNITKQILLDFGIIIEEEPEPSNEDVEQQRQHQREQARLQRHHEMAEKDAEFFDMMAAIDFFDIPDSPWLSEQPSTSSGRR